MFIGYGLLTDRRFPSAGGDPRTRPQKVCANVRTQMKWGFQCNNPGTENFIALDSACTETRTLGWLTKQIDALYSANALIVPAGLSPPFELKTPTKARLVVCNMGEDLTKCVERAHKGAYISLGYAHGDGALEMYESNGARFSGPAYFDSIGKAWCDHPNGQKLIDEAP